MLQFGVRLPLTVKRTAGKAEGNWSLCALLALCPLDGVSFLKTSQHSDGWTIAGARSPLAQVSVYVCELYVPFGRCL